MANQDPAERARAVGDQAKKTVDQLADAGAKQASELADQAKQQVDDAQKSAQDLAANAQDAAKDIQKQAQDLTAEGLEQFRTAAEKASGSIDQATRAAGGTLHEAASSVRSYAPESGAAADFTERFASGLDYTGNYLEQQGESGVVAGLIDFVKRYPVAAAIAGAGILFLLVRAFRRGS